MAIFATPFTLSWSIALSANLIDHGLVVLGAVTRLVKHRSRDRKVEFRRALLLPADRSPPDAMRAAAHAGNLNHIRCEYSCHA